MISHLIEYFDEGDVFVFNDTKVFPARLYGTKEKTDAKIEVFLLRELNESLRLWDVLVEPARKIRIGNKLFFDDDVSFEDNLWVPIVLFHAGSIKVISDVLYVYRVREGSKMQEESLLRKKDILKVACRLAAFSLIRSRT